MPLKLTTISLLVWCWSLATLITNTNGYMVDNNPNRRADYLDPGGKYHLNWMVDWATNRITFNVTVKTRGWVLFGLANNANQATGKDVVVGGVTGNTGKPYFSDRHQVGHSSFAISDAKQDYKLGHAWESRTETFLSFSRSLDTCDPEDYPITQNKVTVIWAYGDGDDYDEVGYRQQGSYKLYLLEPEYNPRIVRDPTGHPALIGHLPSSNKNINLWTVSIKTRMPAAPTSYLCTIHKAPRLPRKHHIIGFDIHLPDALSLEHIHHLTAYRYNAPKGYSARNLFERFVNAPGESCYLPTRPSLKSRGGMPLHFCSELHSGSAIGSRAFFLPPDAGMPIGESPNEYYMIQLHYDNPQNKMNIEVTARLDVWYTSQLRKNDAGWIGVGIEAASLPPSIAVPPQSTSHRVLGHCSKECTHHIFPPEGITLFAGLSHSHNSGSGMRLRHFDIEKNVELPWIMYDDNYSNRFQQMRLFREPVKILPGDQLVMECTFDNTWTNGSVIGGFSTGHEMCVGFLMYHKRIPDYSWCLSGMVSEEGRRRWLGGSENVTWDDDQINWVARSPRQLAGLTVPEIMEGMRWTEEERQALQRYHLTSPALGFCNRDLFTREEESLRMALEERRRAPNNFPPIGVDTEDDFSGWVEYPFSAVPYDPPRKMCSSQIG